MSVKNEVAVIRDYKELVKKPEVLAVFLDWAYSTENPMAVGSAEALERLIDQTFLEEGDQRNLELNLELNMENGHLLSWFKDAVAKANVKGESSHSESEPSESAGAERPFSEGEYLQSGEAPY